MWWALAHTAGQQNLGNGQGYNFKAAHCQIQRNSLETTACQIPGKNVQSRLLRSRRMCTSPSALIGTLHSIEIGGILQKKRSSSFDFNKISFGAIIVRISLTQIYSQDSPNISILFPHPLETDPSLSLVLENISLSTWLTKHCWGTNLLDLEIPPEKSNCRAPTPVSARMRAIL